MTADLMLTEHLTEALGRSYCVLCGRGTTALWLALRAISRRDGLGEVIMPDIVCAAVLEGVLLAGFIPVFADVLPGRLTLSATSVSQLVTSRTRAVILVHLFGHVVEIDLIRQAAPDIPVIEDAVQGIGGYGEERPVGSLSDMSFISFDHNKMIGGRGGALLWDDDSLVDAIEADVHSLPDRPELRLASLASLLPPAAAAAYAYQLCASAPALLRGFDSSVANLDRILAAWSTLGARVEERNTKAHWLQTRLSGLPLVLPEIREGDAIWRYTVTAPTVAFARRMMRGLQLAGLSGSGLYYPLSRFFGQQGGAGRLANRLVNLWVDEVTDGDALRRTADVITALPWQRAFPA